MPSSAQVAETTTKGSALPILAAIANQGKQDSTERYRSFRDLHSPLDRRTSHCARQVAIPLAGRRSPARRTLTPAGTSAIVVTCTSGKVSHAATAQLILN